MSWRFPNHQDSSRITTVLLRFTPMSLRCFSKHTDASRFDKSGVNLSSRGAKIMNVGLGLEDLKKRKLYVRQREPNAHFLAHLSQRLIGELIGYPWSGVRPSSSSVVRRPQFQTSSSPKPLGRSKSNFMWSLLG